ncbi:MAG: sugar phosphate isomerase/epimerase [Acidobacteria bacterium]|nr:MAG: sugar phosphate isomerase/epimerase [Acidobacteriota bacterium]
MDRRSFLGTMTAATLLTRRFGWAADTHKIDKIGLQLYTVRSEIAKDFEGSLAKVASIGYKEVELAGFKMKDGKISYFDRSPQEMRAALDRHGLSAPSTHVDYTSLSEQNFPKVIEASKIIGNQYIVNPWIDDEVRKQPDGFKRAAATFNRAGKASKEAGMQFAYHNHWFEYIPVNGKLPYDILLEESDPNLVKMEMDLCWTMLGGQDPVKYFDQYPGRFPLVHVKDLTSIPPITAGGKQDFGDSMKEMTEVGSGVIDWKRIFAQSDKAGIKHYFVEHDNPKSPFESIKTSYQYLAQLRF